MFLNQDGKLQKGDKILTIDGENVESMPHQDVVKKIRLLNESANSITLCVMREEVCQRNLSTEKVLRFGINLHAYTSKFSHIYIAPSSVSILILKCT